MTASTATASATAAPAQTGLDNPFDGQEYLRRREALQRVLDERGWDALVVSDPSNVYYLTGQNSYGYFATTLLVFTAGGETLLIARGFEGAVAERQCWRTRFVGIGDADDAATVLAAELAALGLADRRIAIELDSMFLPPSVVFQLQAQLPNPLLDGSGSVAGVRSIKSAAELELVRRAGAMSQTAAEAAFATAGAGVNEQQVAAETYRALIGAGSEPPAFPPLIRSTETLRMSHISWRDRELRDGDAVIVEVSGSASRYHAPHTRLGYVGSRPAGAVRATETAMRGMEAIAAAIRPGVAARDVYPAWFECVEAAGLPQPPRVHIGYETGIGFPPSWMVLAGGNKPVSLRPTSDLVLAEGMVFHIFAWMVADPEHLAALSDTVIITERGCEFVTQTPRELRSLG